MTTSLLVRNAVLMALAAAMQNAAGKFIPEAYKFGRNRAEMRYGLFLAWSEMDTINVTQLLERNSAELSRAMATLEKSVAMGEMSLSQAIARLQGRLDLWAWVLSPAVAMGTASYVDQARTEIARIDYPDRPTGLPPSENEPPRNPRGIGGADPAQIGIIWWNSRDDKVCPICVDLTGRWFPAKEAYNIASLVHPRCRCPSNFDVGTPDEAVVGPRVPFRHRARLFDGLGNLGVGL